jgi:hypothetical protein
MVTIGLEGFSVLLVWIGHKMSAFHLFILAKYTLTTRSLAVRVKDMLRSGNYSVAGDQWPILLYKDEIYDAEHPWSGLFRNRLLILV